MIAFVSSGVAESILPRLDAASLREDVAGYLEPRVQRLGYLGEFFRCAGHQPDALLDFMRYTESSKKGLPENLVEVIALTAAMANGNAYERNQHERLSVRLGFGAEWVAAVEKCDPDGDSALGADERAVQRYVLAALRSAGREARPAFEALVEVVGPQSAVAAMLVLGRYAVHAIVVNTLQLAPPVPSIFEDGFQG